MKRLISLGHLKVDHLFQRANVHRKKQDDPYFVAAPLGKDSIGKFMSKISEKANLSRRYTNHSVRASCVTVLQSENVGDRHIASVTTASEHLQPGVLRSSKRQAKIRHGQSHGQISRRTKNKLFKRSPSCRLRGQTSKTQACQCRKRSWSCAIIRPPNEPGKRRRTVSCSPTNCFSVRQRPLYLSRMYIQHCLQVTFLSSFTLSNA